MTSIMSLKYIKILKINKNKDLALIKIKSLRRKVDYFEISKRIPKVGDELHAIGHPEGEMWTYTKGYLNAYRFDYSAFEEASSSQKEENFLFRRCFSNTNTNLSRKFRWASVK